MHFNEEETQEKSGSSLILYGNFVKAHKDMENLYCVHKNHK